MSADLYSVVQFFPNESYEYVRTHVPLEEAIPAFQHYISSVGARLGTTRRVIITDSGDCCCAEWKFGEGIVWPEKPL